MVFRFSWKWRRRSPSKVKERTHEEATEALRAGREGRHPEEAFAGEGAYLQALRRTRLAAHGLLPLAEGVLRERGCCLRAESTPEPLRRPGANRLSGEENPDQGRGLGRADGGAYGPKKNSWGTLTGVWVPHDTRDQIVDFVRRWSEKTEIGAGRFIEWLDITASKFYDWRERYGKVNEHNGWVPRDFWLEDWEKQAIIGFHLKNPLEGYRRLTFMMLDADIVAVSPSSVWRVLSQAGLLSKWNGKPSKKGTRFAQPLTAHQHWHIDVSYLNIGGTFYYLCSILDGFSRYIVDWDIRESMTEADIEIILQGAKESTRKRGPESSRTTGRSSSQKTSRSSFGSQV